MPFGRRLVARGRHLGAYLEAQLIPRQRRDKCHFYRRPMTVMQQFGAAGEETASERSARCTA
jgi:hypothetical protein